jgi:hypothetical protein
VRLPLVPEVSVLAVPLAPIALLPVLPVVPAAVLGVLVSALGAVLGAALGGVVGLAVPADPVAGPAAGAVVPDAALPPPLPDVCAMDSPPTAIAAAAARVVRVLIVDIANSLNGNPEGGIG